MQANRFLYDFGRATKDAFLRELGNVTELIAREELARLLRLCGVEESVITHGSDYDRFFALCKVVPLLTGHPLLCKLRFLCARGLGVEEPLSVSNCAVVWQKTAQKLLETPLTPFLLASRLMGDGHVAWLCQGELPQDLPQSVPPVLFFDDWIDTGAHDLDAWTRQIECAADAFCARGCDRVYLTLPASFHDIRPDPYHVQQALGKGERTQEDRCLLIAQAVRILCGLCREKKLALILSVDCDGEDVTSLLERTERDVGLPTLCWTATRTDTRDALLSLQARPHDNRWDFALELSRYPSSLALSYAVEEAASVYPLGRLQFISGCALQDMAYERQRCLSVLQALEEKNVY